MESDFGSDIFSPGENPKADAAPRRTGGDESPAGETRPAARDASAKATAASDTSPGAASKPAASDSETAPGDAPSGAATDSDAPSRKKRKRVSSRRRKSNPSTETADGPVEGSSRDESVAEDRESTATEDRSEPERPARNRGEEDRDDGDRRERKRGRRRRGRDGGARDSGARDSGARDSGARGGGARDSGTRDSGARGGGAGSRPRPRNKETRPTDRNGQARNLPLRQRIAIFLDAGTLLAQARAAGREISFGHMRRHIAGTRSPIRALAYFGPADEGLAPNLEQGGFEAVCLASNAPPSVALAVDAMAIADRVDCVVLVPGTGDLEHLAAVLRARGVRVESASFAESVDPELSSQHHHQLGTESWFKI